MRIKFDKRKIVNEVKDNASIILRKIAFDGLQRIIRQSPVDTARFKANWSTSISRMHKETYGKPGTPTPMGSLSSPADFRRSTAGITDYNIGQKMFLHNNLAYGIPLEYGHSGQAPKGWIRNVSIQIQKKLNEIKGLI